MSWLQDQDSIDLLLVRYEMMLKDCRTELERIMNFLGWKVSENELLNVIDHSSISKMKAREKSGEFLAHVGQGEGGHWQQEFNDEELRFFLRKAQPVLEKLRYV